MNETTWFQFTIRELLRARARWLESLVQEFALTPENLQNILTRAAVPGALANHYFGVITGFGDFLRGALSAIVARATFDLTVDPKLRQRVIPLDRVAREIGVDLVRDIMSFDNTQVPKKPFGRFNEIRRAFSGELPSVIKEGLTKAAITKFSAFINALLLAGAVVMSVLIAIEVRKRADKIVRSALPQDRTRSRYPHAPFPLRRRPILP